MKLASSRPPNPTRFPHPNSKFRPSVPLEFGHAMATSRAEGALVWPRIPRFQDQFPHLISGEGQVLSTEVLDRGFQGNLESHGSTGTTGGTSKPQFPPLGYSGICHYISKFLCSSGASSSWNGGLSTIATQSRASEQRPSVGI